MATALSSISKLCDSEDSAEMAISKQNETLQTKLRFIYSEKATKFCEIFSFRILQNYVAFSEYMNFTKLCDE